MTTATLAANNLTDIRDLLREGVGQVFETMFGLTAELVAPESVTPDDAALIASSVGFVGRVSGVVYIHLHSSFAEVLTCRMLGISESELEGDEMVNDAIGEVANMVVGHVKSRLCDRGHPCVLTIPAVVRGKGLCIHPVLSAERCVLVFQCGPDHIVVEALLKTG